MIKKLGLLICCTFIFVGCKPTAQDIEKAIAQTQAALPTATVIPTSTTMPTSTIVPTPSATLAPVVTCADENLNLIDIDPSSGLGVFVTVKCSSSDQDRLENIMVIMPVGTPKDMVEKAMIHVYEVASAGGWEVSDVKTLYQIETNDCSTELVTSGNIAAFCTDSAQTTTITSYVSFIDP